MFYLSNWRLQITDSLLTGPISWLFLNYSKAHLCGNISTPKQIDSCNRINFDQLTEYLETLDSLLNKLLASSTDTCGSVRIIRYHLRINLLRFIVDYTPLMRLFCWTAAASAICEATMLKSLRYPLYCTALSKTLQLGILILLQK